MVKKYLYAGRKRRQHKTPQNIEGKERHQIQENMLFLFHIPESSAQLPEGVRNRVLALLHIGSLPVTAQQGQGADHPPCRGNEEGNHHSRALADSDGAGAQHQSQAHQEGDHGAYVAEGITGGGNGVHPFIGGDLREHGIIGHQAGGKAHLGNNVKGQKGQPGPGQAQRRAAQDAHEHADDENRLLEAPVIGQGAADGADQRHQKGGHAAGIAPVSQIMGLIEPRAVGHGVKEDGNQGCCQENEGRIAHVIEHPVPLQRGKANFFFHFSLRIFHSLLKTIDSHFQAVFRFRSNQPNAAANSGPSSLPAVLRAVSWEARMGNRSRASL